jgi:superfamily II DNA or RNA helicase/HKD family nuclease
MGTPAPGLHEDIVTSAIDAYLDEVDTSLVDRRAVDPAEVADRIALHLAQLIERSVDSLGESRRVAGAVEVARRVVELLADEPLEADVAGEEPQRNAKGRAEVLRAIHVRNPDGSPRKVAQPEIPLLDTTLLTNSPGEPRVGHQIRSEIESADRIDVVMAFIRNSGISPLLANLRAHCEDGRALRVLTSTYTNTTQQPALERLAEAGAQVKVSYDTTGTRLHAKAWLFHRDSGHSTAYVGSSNLTHQAQQSGLEWNVRLAQARNRSVIYKIAGVFDSYWESVDFEPFDPDDFAARVASPAAGPIVLLPPTDIRLEPFQERLLERIEVARERGRHRNLLAAATGTGKTVMAAVDYSRLRERLGRSRLLFVAHRAEILEQALATFRHALRDASFGELWVGGNRPTRWDHVFASVQSLSASGMDDLTPEHFDVVVVDEFHHAAADTYVALLEHLEPVELLGLTATPERSDGLPVLDWFDGHIAAELRLWDAIDQHRLSPFEYYGIHDGTDLRELRWVRGRGYDVDGLTNVLTADDAVAHRIIAATGRHVDEIGAMRALGFCVSVEHARFMARKFNEAGVPSVAVWADTPEAERRRALEDLAARRINAVFSVDLFNEGVDVPAVDTLLMMRPTDSPTLFLQQLGRGLRRVADKPACLVLDFIGLQHHSYRFDRRYRALLGGTRAGLTSAVENGFPFLPAGCHMELDAVASEEVLRSIRESVPSNWSAKVAELRSMRDAEVAVTMGNYLAESGLDLEDIYAGNRSWSDLCEAADVETHRAGPHEEVLRRAVGRLLHVDDPERLSFARRVLAGGLPDPAQMPERERRLLRMLTVALADQALGKSIDESMDLDAAVRIVWSHPQVRAEVTELFALLDGQLDHLHPVVGLPEDVPLSVHARYTRLEIQSALADAKGNAVRPPTWREGVRWLDDAQTDVFVFTLDKTDSGFSPTTRYRDYAISRELIHWESQSMTRADSPTGRRYRQHVERGSSVLLFARLNKTERAFWFLGPAQYVSHRSEQPMQVTWRLEAPLPGDLYAQFAAAVA